MITLSPGLLADVYIATLWQRREMIYINVFIGQVLCEILNSKLKKRIQEPRPTSTCPRLLASAYTAYLGRGYGMPSSHSQFCGFFAAFWLLHMARYWPTGVRFTRSIISRRCEQAASATLVVFITVFTCLSRYVARAYH